MKKMQNKKQAKDETWPVTLRLPLNLYQVVSAQADKERRSFTAQVTVLLELALAKGK